MRILVCLKQVTYLYSRIGIDSMGKVDPDAVTYVLNPYDEIALEEALRIKQKIGQAEVTLISVGPKRVEEVLRYGIAMGADRGICICYDNLGNINPWITSKALAKVMEAEGFNLILCGKKAIDDNGGVVGGFLAELLDVPFVSSVTEIVLLQGKTARFYKMLGKGDRQLMQCDLPAVLSVERGLIKPRYPTIKGRLNASRKEIIKFEFTELGISSLLAAEPQMKISRLSISRPKPKKIFTPDSSLPVEKRVKMIMSGGLLEKKKSPLKGSPQELADLFINFLEENRIVRKSSN